MKKLSPRQYEISENIPKYDPQKALANWYDWHWQMQHTIKDLKIFQRLLGVSFSEEKKQQLEQTLEKFPLSITPYYLSLIDPSDLENDPIYKQAFPSPLELQTMKSDMSDPLSEDKDSPVPGITHRYPDRVLLLVSNMCSMYCRHCTRKRKVGDRDSIPDKAAITKAIDYIRNNKTIRDVLLSGGDPLMLSDNFLDWILKELRSIEHVEIIRLGTRTPVVLPYRITDNLVSILKKYHPLWINTHFNHPREITESAKLALTKLADAGLPLGNQSVLLAGVNDCPRIMKRLVHKLVQNRIRPYYLYQCDLADGLTHFRTPIGKGMEIMESLIGHTSGLCVPTYVIDAPGGGGKIPVMPQYLISWSTNKVILRNYEGVITTYREPDSYEPIFCDRNCADCQLQLHMEQVKEPEIVGIEKLLSDQDKTISLVPHDNRRIRRRQNNKT